MNSNKKRLYKKLAKWFTILAYAMIFLFITGFVLALTLTDVIKLNEIIIILIPMFLTSIFGFLGIIFTNELRSYATQIKMYKERKMFFHIMDLLEKGYMDIAINYYNSSIPQGIIKDFLWGHIITRKLLSDDPEHKAQAVEKINKLKEEWNPNNLF